MSESVDQSHTKSIEKAHTENGSTNLSEGTSEVDQEFKVKKGEKFQFINETVENWPQWTVDQAQTEQEKKPTKEEQAALLMKAQEEKLKML